MGLHNIRDRLTCIDFFRPRLSCYNSSYKGVIGFPFIANPGELGAIVTDRLRSYSAAAKEPGCADKQVTQRWANNRAENSHLPFRRRERAMLRFRRMHSLQKFASIHASFHNHFNSQRSLSTRSTFKLNRDAALTEWRSLIAS